MIIGILLGIAIAGGGFLVFEEGVKQGTRHSSIEKCLEEAATLQAEHDSLLASLECSQANKPELQPH